MSEIEDVTVIGSDNQTLLQHAIVWRHELAAPLVDAGAPLDHQDEKGQTALQYAIARSMWDLSLKLIESGANPNLIDEYGNNALWTAVLNPKPDYDVIAALAAAKADPNRINNAGRSPMDMAKTKQNQRMLDILQRRDD